MGSEPVNEPVGTPPIPPLKLPAKLATRLEHALALPDAARFAAATILGDSADSNAATSRSNRLSFFFRSAISVAVTASSIISGPRDGFGVISAITAATPTVEP